jgi:hypothetical protein
LSKRLSGRLEILPEVKILSHMQFWRIIDFMYYEVLPSGDNWEIGQFHGTRVGLTLPKVYLSRKAGFWDNYFIDYQGGVMCVPEAAERLRGECSPGGHYKPPLENNEYTQGT